MLSLVTLLFALLLPALLNGFETHQATNYGELRGLINHDGSSRMGLGDEVVLSQTTFTEETPPTTLRSAIYTE